METFEEIISQFSNLSFKYYLTLLKLSNFVKYDNRYPLKLRRLYIHKIRSNKDYLSNIESSHSLFLMLLSLLIKKLIIWLFSSKFINLLISSFTEPLTLYSLVINTRASAVAFTNWSSLFTRFSLGKSGMPTGHTWGLFSFSPRA